MRSITCKATQSLNLGDYLFSEVTKMIRKTSYRSIRCQVALRAWSRQTVKRFGNPLMVAAAISAFCFFASMCAHQNAAAAVSLFFAAAAMTPEMILMSFDSENDDEL